MSLRTQARTSISGWVTRPAGASCPTSSATTSQRAVPQLVQQLTGQPYRGRVESGIGDRTRQGWITVRFVTQEEEPDISDGACGRARVGQDPGYIWTIRRARGNKYCVDPRYFPEVFTHEFGHAMGFTHVADRTAVMGPRACGMGRAPLTPASSITRSLAFEVGPDHEYCGWPFQRSVCHAEARVPNGRPGPPATDHRHRLKMVGPYTNPRHSLAFPKQMWWALRRFRKIAGQRHAQNAPTDSRKASPTALRAIDGGDTAAAITAMPAARPVAAQPRTDALKIELGWARPSPSLPARARQLPDLPTPPDRHAHSTRHAHGLWVAMGDAHSARSSNTSTVKALRPFNGGETSPPPPPGPPPEQARPGPGLLCSTPHTPRAQGHVCTTGRRPADR